MIIGKRDILRFCIKAGLGRTSLIYLFPPSSACTELDQDQWPVASVQSVCWRLSWDTGAGVGGQSEGHQEEYQIHTSSRQHCTPLSMLRVDSGHVGSVFSEQPRQSD